MSKTKKKMSYTTKYLLIACTFLLTVSILLGIVLTMQSKLAMTVLIRSRMLDASNTAAAFLDGDLLKSITAVDEEDNTENYQTVMKTLTMFHENMDMAYIYTVKSLGGKNFVFVVDSDPIDPGKFGEPIVYSDALYQASQGVAAVDSRPISDRWGSFYSAFTPVFDSEGNVAGIVGVDYDSQWFEDQIAMNTASILIISVLSLLVASFIILLITNRFRRKINALSAELSSLSEEVEALNREMASPEEFKSDRAHWQAQIPNSDASSSSSFDALGDKIRQARQHVKQYVSYVREQDFTDSLTGVGNKRAYLDLVREMDHKIKEGSAAFTLVLFDVNSLRFANDEYGLTIGDQMITDTATLLLRVFDPEFIFRIGSDEFVLLMENMLPEDLKEDFETLENELRRFNEKEKTYEMTLSFTRGVASLDPEQDHSCSEVFKKATKDLSKNKAAYYRTEGDRRKQ